LIKRTKKIKKPQEYLRFYEKEVSRNKKIATSSTSIGI
jgi:hypothetical protein